MRRLLLALAFASAATVALAVEPGEQFADPALEARVRAVTRQIRCVVCQNQSIDESEAELAREMRLLVRERVAAGAGEQEAIAFLVARYGDYVLLDPPFKPKTWALWIGPWIVLGLAALVAATWFRSRASRSEAAEVPPLSAAERARLDALIEEIEGPRPGDAGTAP